MPAPTTPDVPFAEGQEHLSPDFALSAWKAGGSDPSDVEITVHFTSDPSPEKHASLPLLYGLAIMALDQQGVIAAEIDKMLAKGPLSEAQACNHISLLIQQEANDQPV